MRRALAILILALLAPPAHAAAPVWRSTGGGTFALDRAALRAALRAGAVDIPAPDGSTRRVRFRSSPVMAASLARASDFHSFAGRWVRFDTGRLGFHAAVRSPRGSWYVDPLGGGRYVARAFGAPRERAREVVRHRRPPGTPGRVSRAGGGAVVRRTYRLALASDPSYAAKVGGAANVTTAKGVLVERLDQIYEADLGIHLDLIATNGLLNFTSTSTYGADPTCDSQLLSANTGIISGKVGAGSYDIGHVVLGTDGGGVAQLPSVGQSGVKGAGCTGLPNPVGDAFAVDYVAHEMGHQFGANHTFNGTQPPCGSQRNDATAVEPGSGSSVMAYAGICGSDDLQAHSDPYFSQASIAEIAAYTSRSISGATNGGTLVPTTDRAPIVYAPTTRTIPLRTPFSLLGGATDADGDTLTYLWEQNDHGTGAALTDTARTNGPLFRQFGVASIQANPFAYGADGENVARPGDYLRTFPDPAQIAGGATNALTGTCTTTDCLSEFLPTTSRELDFRLTARDGAGGVASADTRLVATGKDPFRVTAPSAGSFAGGDRVAVTWDPVGTACAPYSTTAVRIAFSADGGLTFPYPVLDATANDGAEAVTVPNVATTKGRFRVEAVGNVFFDVSHGDVVVGTGPGAVASPSPPAGPLTSTPAPASIPASAYYDIPCAPVPTVTADPAADGTPTSPGPGQTPAATPTVVAGVSLRPSLAGTRRRLKVSRRRRTKVRLRCVVVGDGRPPTRCRGTLGLRRSVHRSFSIPVSARASVTMRVAPRVFRRLRGGRRLTTTVRASVGSATASRRVTLKR